MTELPFWYRATEPGVIGPALIVAAVALAAIGQGLWLTGLVYFQLMLMDRPLTRLPARVIVAT